MKAPNVHPCLHKRMCLLLTIAVAVTINLPPEAAWASCSSQNPLNTWDAPYPPTQPPRDGNNLDCSFDRFAWQSFVALQWPAIPPTASNGYKRGFADTSKQFTTENDPELPVWQTWKAKREIFLGLDGADGAAPRPWNSQIYYGPQISDGSFTVCSDAADPSAVRQALQGGLHAFSLSSKVTSEGIDENIEVNGEAFYPASIRGQKAEPQVFKTSTGNPVLYEVKVNYDWFNYVTGHRFYDTKVKNAARVAGTIRLPARGSSYNPGNCSSSSSVPCSMGAIETKSAWLLAGPGDDVSRYHSTQALYFKADSGGTSGLCADLGTFLLTGFHINQKTENQPFFIYSTFGHVDNGKNNDEFRYQNQRKSDDALIPPAGYGIGYITSTGSNSHGGPTYGPSRIPHRTQSFNRQVQAQIRAANPNSVWQNYQLVGVQFATKNADATQGNYPIGSNDPGHVGQSYYLANLTLETSWGLQNFQGSPPELVPIHTFANYIPSRCESLDHYDRNCPNIVNTLDGTAYNTGGCMGCHGIAQLLGTDFSFVLLVGGGEIDPAPAPRPNFCGNSVCSSSETCVNGSCCNSGNVCGGSCCQDGDSCVDGYYCQSCVQLGDACTEGQDQCCNAICVGGYCSRI